jgi:tetratricopeptide (TPR) repeat protein
MEKSVMLDRGNTAANRVRRFGTGPAAAGVVGVAVASLLLGGCGQGKSTRAHKERAELAQAQLKSATEWDMARQAYLAGDLEKAIRHADNSIQLNENVAKSHVLRGRILMEQSLFDRALASFDRARDIAPPEGQDRMDAEYFTGLCYERIGRKHEAMRHYIAASELDRSNAQYAVAAAEMMIDLEQVDRAERFLTVDGESFEHNAGVRQTLGHIAMLRDDFDRAAELFAEARVLAPEDAGILEDLARAQVATQRYAEAEYHLNQLLQMPANANRRDLKHLRAKCLVAVDRPMEAREILLALTSDDEGSKDFQAWIELGHVAYVIGDSHRLRQASTRAVSMAPHRPEGYMLRALMQRKEGNLQEALTTLSQAVERRGADTTPLVLHGIVAQQLGRFEAARRSFEAAYAENPQNDRVARLLEGLNEQERRVVTVPTDSGQ